MPFMDGLLAKTTSGLTVSGLENLDKNTPNVFITNHRDIVLDSAQLSYSLIKGGFDTCEIAIGNNLLIFDWINKLVRLNKCFIVKRNLGRMQTLAADCYLIVDFNFCVIGVEFSVSLFVRLLNTLYALNNILSVNVVHINSGGVADKSKNR